jgi:hypothetical protein
MKHIDNAAQLPHPLNCIADVIIGYARSLDPQGEFQWLGGINLNQPNNFFGYLFKPRKGYFKVFVKRWANVPVDVRQRCLPDGYAMFDSYIHFKVSKYEQVPDVLAWVKASAAMPYRRSHRKAA